MAYNFTMLHELTQIGKDFSLCVFVVETKKKKRYSGNNQFHTKKNCNEQGGRPTKHPSHSFSKLLEIKIIADASEEYND